MSSLSDYQPQDVIEIPVIHEKKSYSQNLGKTFAFSNLNKLVKTTNMHDVPRCSAFVNSISNMSNSMDVPVLHQPLSLPSVCQNSSSVNPNLRKDTQMFPVIHKTANSLQPKHNSVTHHVQIHEVVQKSTMNKKTNNPLSSHRVDSFDGLLKPVKSEAYTGAKIFDGTKKTFPNDIKSCESNLRPLERSERVNFDEIGKHSQQFVNDSHHIREPFLTNIQQSSSLFLDNMRSISSTILPSTAWITDSKPAHCSIQTQSTPSYRFQPILSSTTCPMYTAAVYSWTRTNPCVTTSLISTTKGFHLVFLLF